MSIFDFFTREAGQERRRALEGLLTQFIPPEMRPQLGLLAEAQPIRGAERAGQGAVRVMNTQGMDRVQAIGDTLSEMAGVVAPAMVAGRAGVPVANAVQDVLTGYAPMVQPFMVDESGALRLFHGSPHDFDRFSMAKIGTGEGAQAYGHGLYFAENEDIAKSYRDQLANGWRLEVRDPIREAGLSGRDLDSASQMLSTSYSGDAAATDWENWTGKVLTPEQRAAFTEAFKRKGGSMYEVNVNANPEDFINFDAPFEQQPPNVQKHFAYLARGESKPTGEDLARRMESNIYIQEAAQAGIPGIRYLDAGSRSFTPTTIKEGPSGVELYWGNDPRPVDTFPTRQAAEEAAKQFDTRSRNYVVFDENLIEIVRKYGIAGAAAMLGMSQADVAQAMQQQPQPQGLLTGPQ